MADAARRIDPGEEPWEAALRELKEEIGTDNVEYLGEADRWLRYDFPPWVFHMYVNSHKGQEQQWFAVRFLGQDSEINIQTDQRNSCRGVGPTWPEAVELIVDFKRPSYAEVARQFARFAG